MGESLRLFIPASRTMFFGLSNVRKAFESPRKTQEPAASERKATSPRSRPQLTRTDALTSRSCTQTGNTAELTGLAPLAPRGRVPVRLSALGDHTEALTLHGNVAQHAVPVASISSTQPAVSLEDIKESLAKWDGPQVAKDSILKAAQQKSYALHLREMDLESLPECIGRMGHLKRIDLSNNRRLSALPGNLVHLSQLTTLICENCDLHSLPQDLESLGNLERLELGNNPNFTAFPPMAAGSLRKLRSLFLENCGLSSFPAELCTQSHQALSQLQLSGNKNLRALPPELCQLPALSMLGLNACAIKRLPSGLGEMPWLSTLLVNDNPELHSFPSGKYPQLSELEAARCGLQAIAPTLIGNRLSSLDLSGNPLIKSLPVELGASNVVELKLEECDIAELPPNLGKNGRLLFLDVRRNARLEKLPQSINPLKTEILCRGAPIRLMNDLMERPVPRATRAPLEAELGQLKARWRQIESAMGGKVQPAWALAAKSELQKALTGTSGTLQATASSTLAQRNWLQAQSQIQVWSQEGRPITTERLKLLNSMLGQDLHPFNDNRALEKFEAVFGQFRRQPTGFTLRNGDPAHLIDEREIGIEMLDFEDWFARNQSDVTAGKMQPEELAVLTYQRLVSIHPFPDANGRSARLAANWVMQSHGLPSIEISNEKLMLFSAGKNSAPPELALEMAAAGLKKTVEIYERHMGKPPDHT